MNNPKSSHQSSTFPRIAGNLGCLALGACVAINLFNFYWVDFFIVSIYSIGIYQVFRGKSASFTTEFNLKLNFFNILLIIFLSSGILGYILSSPMGKDQWSDILGLRWVLGFYAFYYLGRQCCIHKKTLHLFSLLPACAILYILLRHLHDTDGKLITPSFRLQGFYQNPNHFALTAMLLWTCTLGLTVIPGKSKTNFALNIILTTMTAISLMASYSRSAWVGAFAAFIVAIYYSKNKKLYYVASGMLLCIAVMLSLNSFGIQDRLLYSFDVSSASAQSLRLTVWKVAWQIFIDHPFFGVGFAENARLFPEYYAKLGFSSNDIIGNTHNQYLEILSGAGLFGFLAYIGIFMLCLRFFHQKFKNTKLTQEKQISLAAILITVALLISSFTDTPFRLHETRNYLIILLGFSFGYLDITGIMKNHSAS